ncbi:hypothetical protein DRO31_03925 [Candidatus Bathyarchaeota archaeon]|nr:MAG: hypothetical protein DRO31_03925 [Candidatus Bathyarchaeota archaeon]
MLDETSLAITEPLTAERIKELWSKTYNKVGKPDWSHIFPYYHNDIVFQDTIQRIEGKEAFIELCNRLTDRCEQLSMLYRLSLNTVHWILSYILITGICKGQ